MPSPLPHWWGTSERFNLSSELPLTWDWIPVHILLHSLASPSYPLFLQIDPKNTPNKQPDCYYLSQTLCRFPGHWPAKEFVCYVSHAQGYLLQALDNCFYLPAKLSSQLFLLFSPLIPSNLCSNANNEGPFWWLCVKHQVSHSPLPAWCPPCGMVYYYLCPVRCFLVHLFALASERQGSPLICSLLFPWQRDGWYQVRLVLVWLSLKLARISRWSVMRVSAGGFAAGSRGRCLWFCVIFFHDSLIPSIHLG